MSESVLSCSRCGRSYTHLQEVIVTYQRGGTPYGNGDGHQDGESRETRVDAHTGEAQVHRDCRGNPSSRRGAAVLVFSCELCDHLTRIVFKQHKGWTLVEGLRETCAAGESE